MESKSMFLIFSKHARILLKGVENSMGWADRWENPWISEHAKLGEKEQALQKSCDLADRWDHCGPLKSNAQLREKAEDTSAKTVRGNCLLKCR